MISRMSPVRSMLVIYLILIKRSKYDLFFIKSFRTKKNIIIVEPLINAERIINNTSATVSIPFTSTGVAANYKGKPSAYTI